MRLTRPACWRRAPKPPRTPTLAKLTWDIYWHGTIGAAKDLDKRVIDIRKRLAAKGGDARVSVLKAVVTQASAAIPAMPIYLALLFKVMKEQGIHGLHRTGGRPVPRFPLWRRPTWMKGRLRADRRNSTRLSRPRWACGEQINTDTLRQLSDFEGYKREFLQLFGFEVEGVDYEADVNPDVAIEHMA